MSLWCYDWCAFWGQTAFGFLKVFSQTSCEENCWEISTIVLRYSFNLGAFDWLASVFWENFDTSLKLRYSTWEEELASPFTTKLDFLIILKKVFFSVWAYFSFQYLLISAVTAALLLFYIDIVYYCILDSTEPILLSLCSISMSKSKYGYL